MSTIDWLTCGLLLTASLAAASIAGLVYAVRELNVYTYGLQQSIASLKAKLIAQEKWQADDGARSRKAFREFDNMMVKQISLSADSTSANLHSKLQEDIGPILDHIQNIDAKIQTLSDGYNTLNAESGARNAQLDQRMEQLQESTASTQLVDIMSDELFGMKTILQTLVPAPKSKKKGRYSERKRS